MKSIILATVLLSIDSFADVFVNESGCFTTGSNVGYSNNIGTAPANGLSWYQNPSCSEKYLGQNYGTYIIYFSGSEGTITPDVTIYCNGYWSTKIPAPCPTCNGTWSNTSQTCITPPLSAFNNDPSGCESAGGYYFNDGFCLDGTDAISKVFTDPEAVIGGIIFINGAAWSIMGAYALPVTAGTSAAAISYGAHAMLAGTGLMAHSALGQLFLQPDVIPQSDSTTGDNRIKVSLTDKQETVMTEANTATGKVEKVSYIPPEVRQRIIDGVVNPTTGLPNDSSPSKLSGTKATTYDYSTNTATTQTVQPDGTTTSQTTSFTTATNPNGSVTTTPTNTAVAPVVTGTKGTTSQDPGWSSYTTINNYTSGSTGGGSATGDTTADSLLNASMPGYDFGTNTGLNDLESHNIDNMVSNTDSLRTNISNQISASTTLLNNTKALFDGSWQTPQFGSGQCGTGMQLDIWGKHIDLCQTITNYISPLQPLFSFITTVALMALAVVTFLGGL